MRPGFLSLVNRIGAGFPACWAGIFLWASSGAARAEVPQIDYLFPAGLQRGTTNLISAGGKLDPWPLETWTDHPSLVFKAAEKKGEFTATVSTNAPLGPRLVRFFNAGGASSARVFLISHLLETQESEPNNHHSQAQVITNVPSVINGRLHKSGETDSFAVHLEKGQWLIAALDAYRLDSPLDPILHLLDEQGVKLAFNHDHEGRSLDPFLAWQAQAPGLHIVQLAAFAYPPRADVRFAGEDSAVYRLMLSHGPYVDHTFPIRLPRGHKSSLFLHGWNLGQSGGIARVELDPAGTANDENNLTMTIPGSDNVWTVALADQADHYEAEPNDAPDLAQAIPAPGGAQGRIGRPGDVDHYKFHSNKGDKWRLRVESKSLGFPLDAWVMIQDPSGRVLSQSDDHSGSTDPQIDWTAPAAGEYQVLVKDLLGRGGLNFSYRLEVSQPSPGFTAVVEGDAFRLTAGETLELKVTVQRLNGHQADLALLANQLPEGVHSLAAPVPAKGGEVLLKLLAAPEAKPANQPFQLWAVEVNEKHPRLRRVAATLKGKNSAAGGLFVNQVMQPWLTVLPKPPSPPESETEKK